MAKLAVQLYVEFSTLFVHELQTILWLEYMIKQEGEDSLLFRTLLQTGIEYSLIQKLIRNTIPL